MYLPPENKNTKGMNYKGFLCWYLFHGLYSEYLYTCIFPHIFSTHELWLNKFQHVILFIHVQRKKNIYKKNYFFYSIQFFLSLKKNIQRLNVFPINKKVIEKNYEVCVYYFISFQTCFQLWFKKNWPDLKGKGLQKEYFII